jgi:hypothetical protein
VTAITGPAAPRLAPGRCRARKRRFAVTLVIPSVHHRLRHVEREPDVVMSKGVRSRATPSSATVSPVSFDGWRFGCEPGVERGTTAGSRASEARRRHERRQARRVRRPPRRRGDPGRFRAAGGGGHTRRSERSAGRTDRGDARLRRRPRSEQPARSAPRPAGQPASGTAQPAGHAAGPTGPAGDAQLGAATDDHRRRRTGELGSGHPGGSAGRRRRR